jgi:hypothetical protein
MGKSRMDTKHKELHLARTTSKSGKRQYNRDYYRKVTKKRRGK